MSAPVRLIQGSSSARALIERGRITHDSSSFEKAETWRAIAKRMDAPTRMSWRFLPQMAAVFVAIGVLLSPILLLHRVTPQLLISTEDRSPERSLDRRLARTLGGDIELKVPFATLRATADANVQIIPYLFERGANVTVNGGVITSVRSPRFVMVASDNSGFQLIDVSRQLPATQSANAIGSGGVSEANASEGISEQNRLYREVLAARDRGDGRALLAAVDEYQRRYPRGILLAEAMTERLAELLREDRIEEARAAADRLLVLFPESARSKEVSEIRRRLANP